MPRTISLQRRRGISLLEIMVSIGVLSVGLLGILALMPAASNQAKIGAQQDAAAILARRAFREMNVRWHGQPAAILAPVPTTPPATGLPVLPNFYCIDPLGISLRSAAGFTNFELSRMAGEPNIGNGATSAHRITFASLAGTPTSPVIDEVFRSKDELFFGEFASRENPAPNPPQQVALRDTTNTAVKRFSTGDLSWFATVVPRATGFNTVSIAVVNKRSSDEFWQTVNPATSLIVGGIGEIEIPFTTPLNEAWTNVKTGDWIMLTSVVTPGGVGTAEWYRILGTGTRDADNDGVDDVLAYTVDGADWNGLHANPPSLAGPPARNITTFAVLIPNVIAVHSRSLPR